MKRFKKKILSSCRKSRADIRVIIASIVIVLFFAFLSRILSGSPIYMLRFIGMKNQIPRAWVFSCIWTFWYIILGFSFGFVLSCKKAGKDVYKFKGSLWFVCMMIFNIVWYPLFFRAGAIFISLADIVIIALFCLLTAKEYYKINKAIGIALFCHLVWLVHCFVINFRVFLNI